MRTFIFVLIKIQLVADEHRVDILCMKQSVLLKVQTDIITLFLTSYAGLHIRKLHKNVKA